MNNPAIVNSKKFTVPTGNCNHSGLSQPVAEENIKKTGKKKTLSDKKPVPVKKLKAPSEKQLGNYFTTIAPAKRTGYAVVGLGVLTLGQLIQAFQHCKFAKSYI